SCHGADGKGGLNWFPSKKLEWQNWVTDVKENDVTPASFSLNQNYPNPFNPSTKITFSITKAAKTVLNVYNVLGQKVATLIDKELSAGQHEVTFDASKLTTGVYFYKLESGSNFEIKKMLLVK
nr:T9SS type A sorting domain-containing protein [Ignavibacteriaceae bacterium]